MIEDDFDGQVEVTKDWFVLLESGKEKDTSKGSVIQPAKTAKEAKFAAMKHFNTKYPEHAPFIIVAMNRV